MGSKGTLGINCVVGNSGVATFQIPAWRTHDAQKNKDVCMVESYVFIAPSYDELKEWV